MTTHGAYWVAYYKKYPSTLHDESNTIKIKYYNKYKHMSFDELRTIACESDIHAYWFAKFIDSDFHHETYQAVLETRYEDMYLEDVMKIDINENQTEGI